MSILIDGVKIPESCFECPCIDYFKRQFYCHIINDLITTELDGRDERCPLKEVEIDIQLDKDETKKIKIGIFDIVEEYPNCTVQLLRNSITGEESIGWFNNDEPPVTVD